MQLERNGNVILDIKENKNKVTITLENQKLSISKDAYKETNFYIGKPINEIDLEKIKEIDSISKTLSYIYKVISKKRYSEKEIINKLHAKNLKNKEIFIILDILKSKHLIDDELFLIEFINECNYKKYGKLRIIKDLNLKGISEIDKVEFIYQNEITKAKQLLPKLENKYSHLSYNLMLNKIHSSLTNLGYEECVIKEVLTYLNKIDPYIELTKLRKELKIARLRREKKLNGKLLKDKVFAFLISKGYELKDITKVWEEQIYEDDS